MALPKTPALTTDCVIFDSRGRVLLIRRGHPPYAGSYALPGGFVEIGERVEEACRREALEETGVEVGELRLVGVYSDPNRDPRGHTVSAAFLIKPRSTKAVGGDDAESATFVENWKSLKLAFDHSHIVADALKR